jgi:hypothetical protein
LMRVVKNLTGRLDFIHGLRFVLFVSSAFPRLHYLTIISPTGCGA